MSKLAKWVLIGAMILVPTVGFAVTKYRAQHESCPAKPGCPCEQSNR